MTLTEALEFLADYVTEDGFAEAEIADDLWHSPAFLKEWDAVMADAILHGQLSQGYWSEVCNTSQPTNFIVSFAKLWNVLTKTGVVYPLKAIPTFVPDITLRLWAYIEYWEPVTEDLFVNDYFQMLPLLEAATDPNCPKQDLCQEGIIHIFRQLSPTPVDWQRLTKALPPWIHYIEKTGLGWLIGVNNSDQIFQINSSDGSIIPGVRLKDKILFTTF